MPSTIVNGGKQKEMDLKLQIRLAVVEAGFISSIAEVSGGYNVKAYGASIAVSSSLLSTILTELEIKSESTSLKNTLFVPCV